MTAIRSSVVRLARSHALAHHRLDRGLRLDSGFGIRDSGFAIRDWGFGIGGFAIRDSG
jgi:hypothetical protein